MSATSDQPPLQPAPKPRRRRSCFGLGCLSFLALVFIFFVGIPSFTCVTKWWEIRSALSNAKSVKLVHFNLYAHIRGHEMIYGTKDLQPEDVSKLSSAFIPFLDIGFPGLLVSCFDPHHKIIITDSVGHETVISICFHCDNMAIGEENGLFGIPLLWQLRLRHFFNEEGLPYTPRRYEEDYRNAQKDLKIEKTQ